MLSGEATVVFVFGVEICAFVDTNDIMHKNNNINTFFIILSFIDNYRNFISQSAVLKVLILYLDIFTKHLLINNLHGFIFFTIHIV